MSATIDLQRLEEIVDASGVAAMIEAKLPVGVRSRQLRVKTLLLGVLLALADGRPAHLIRVYEALQSLPEAQQWRLGVLTQWKTGPHPLSYRQTERTFMLVVRALGKEMPDGEPPAALCIVIDRLLEASVVLAGGAGSSSLAVDWTDYESHFRAPVKRRERECDGPDGARQGEGKDSREPERSSIDGEASWGRRHGQGQRDEPFFGYYLQAATIVKDEQGSDVPELCRRILLTSAHVDPPGAFVAVFRRMVKDGIALGDILADCGYSYREAKTWALPLRMMGARLVVDIHPNDRGQKGTHMGALIANGNLYCPATPTALLSLSPLARGQSAEEVASHDRLAGELSRYKLSTISANDADGYHRVCCPAVSGKVRCPLRPDSLALSYAHPSVTEAPADKPPCCSQSTITVPPSVNAKTKGKHDYPSKAHRHSYARRSAAERTFSTVKDPARNDISAKGWCRISGLTGPSIFMSCLFCVRNMRVADAFMARKADEERRAACGAPPRRRRRRRETISDLVGAVGAPPP